MDGQKKIAWTFSQLGLLAKSHQSKTNISKLTLSTCGNFCSRAVHKINTILSASQEDFFGVSHNNKAKIFIRLPRSAFKWILNSFKTEGNELKSPIVLSGILQGFKINLNVDLNNLMNIFALLSSDLSKNPLDSLKDMYLSCELLWNRSYCKY